MTDQTTKIPKGWKMTTLGEVIFPVSDTFDFKGVNKVHFLNTGDILEGKLLHYQLSQTNTLPGQAKKRFRLNDILYSEIRPANKRYMLVNFDSSNSVASTKLMVLRAKEGVDVNYVYKYITFREVLNIFQAIAESRSGTFPQITFDSISKLDFLLPPLPEQRAIAGVLSSLDDKIELLREQNKTLEATAQAIFKEWFVRFNFPNENGEPYATAGGRMIDSELGPIPEGWRVGRLGETGKIVCGKTPSKENPDYFGGKIPFIKIPDMHGELFIIKTEDSLTELGANTQKNKFVPKNSICVSCIATIGLVSITSRDSQTNQQINSIIPNDIKLLEYLYFVLKTMKSDLIAIGNGGSATLNINTSVFSEIEIIIPNDESIKKFHTVTEKLFTKILNNLYQIQTLSTLRDTLLPKLMKGEIRVEGFKE